MKFDWNNWQFQLEIGNRKHNDHSAKMVHRCRPQEDDHQLDHTVKPNAFCRFLWRWMLCERSIADTELRCRERPWRLADVCLPHSQPSLANRAVRTPQFGELGPSRTERSAIQRETQHPTPQKSTKSIWFDGMIKLMIVFLWTTIMNQVHFSGIELVRFGRFR